LAVKTAESEEVRLPGMVKTHETVGHRNLPVMSGLMCLFYASTGICGLPPSR
jgi:hypothetical protein